MFLLDIYSRSGKCTWNVHNENNNKHLHYCKNRILGLYDASLVLFYKTNHSYPSIKMIQSADFGVHFDKKIPFDNYHHFPSSNLIYKTNRHYSLLHSHQKSAFTSCRILTVAYECHCCYFFKVKTLQLLQ